MPRKPSGEGQFTRQFSTSLTRDDLRKSFRSGRSYIWPPNGAPDELEYYVSVTNALNGLPKPALPRWAAKVVAEHAVENFEALDALVGSGDLSGAVNWLKQAPWGARDRAADIGTAVHAVAELDAMGQTAEADEIVATLAPDGQAKAKQVRHFFSEIPVKIEMVEAVVYNDTYKYAGTLDFVVRLEDEALLKLWPGLGEPLSIVLDVKTGKGVYDEVALQLAAYRYAEKVVELSTASLQPMPKTEGGGVLHITEDEWRLIPVDTSKEVFRKFCRSLALAVELPLSGFVGTPAVRGHA